MKQKVIKNLTMSTNFYFNFFHHSDMLKIFALFAVTLAKVDHHETQEFWVYPGGEEHTHVGQKVTKEVF